MQTKLCMRTAHETSRGPICWRWTRFACIQLLFPARANGESQNCTCVKQVVALMSLPNVMAMSHDDHRLIFAFWTYHVTSACTYLTSSTQIHHCLSLRPLKPTWCPPSAIFQVLCIDLHHSQWRSLQKSVLLYRVQLESWPGLSASSLWNTAYLLYLRMTVAEQWLAKCMVMSIAASQGRHNCRRASYSPTDRWRGRMWPSSVHTPACLSSSSQLLWNGATQASFAELST